MKIKVPVKDLRDALGRLAHIPGASGASVHTQAVTLEAGLAGLTLSRFTSESKISITLDDEIEVANDEGTPRVSHGALLSLVSTFGTKLVEITSDEKLIYFKSGKDNSKLKVFDEDIMSEPPEAELETEYVPMLLEDLVAMLSFCLPAVSKDSAGSYVFCGVCIRMVENRLYFMATDKRRCHVAIGDYELHADCIIPAEGVEAIIKAIGPQTGGCKFCIGETSATIISDNLEMSVTLLAEHFPDSVQKFLNQPETSIESKVVVPKDEFTEGLQKCAKINEDESRIVNMMVEKKVLTLTGSNQRDSELATPIDCQATKAGAFGVPAKQLAQGLEKMKAAEDGTIELLFFLGAVFVKQHDRMAFFALAKPTA